MPGKSLSTPILSESPKLDSDPKTLYVNDAGLNLVHQIDIASGKKKTLVQFPSFPNQGTHCAAGRRCGAG